MPVIKIVPFDAVKSALQPRNTEKIARKVLPETKGDIVFISKTPSLFKRMQNAFAKLFKV